MKYAVMLIWLICLTIAGLWTVYSANTARGLQAPPALKTRAPRHSQVLCHGRDYRNKGDRKHSIRPYHFQVVTCIDGTMAIKVLSN